MLKYLDEPPRSSRWVGHAVLAVSLGLNALFIFHALEMRPIRAETPGLSPDAAAAAVLRDASLTHSRAEKCFPGDRVEGEPREQRPGAPAPEDMLEPPLEPRTPLTTEVGVSAPRNDARVQL